MRKITALAIDAFLDGYSFYSGNTIVEQTNSASVMYLHGRLIAMISPSGKLLISNGGWSSNTTKERLNGIPNVNIVQKNFVWYLNGVAWDGSTIAVEKTSSQKD